MIVWFKSEYVTYFLRDFFDIHGGNWKRAKDLKSWKSQFDWVKFCDKLQNF